jgi:hypothetical protein
MLEQIHPRVTRNTGQVEGVDATIFPVTTLQPGATVTAYMVGAGGNAIHDDFDVPDLDALAEAQGVEPIRDIDELVADFWPEDERPEDLTAAVRRWRDEGHHRND